MSNLRDIKQLLQQGNSNICILSHVNPDGDAIGSALGLYHILQKAGHTVQVIIPNDIPEFLSWMPGFDKIIIYKRDKQKATDVIKEAGLFYYLDFNHADRLDKMEKLLATYQTFKILIDHHPHPEKIADEIICDAAASSTAELVYQYIQKLELGQYIDRNAAACFFAGIMSDTGCFSYNSSNPETYKVITSLLQYNIDKDGIYAAVYDNFSADRMRLLGYCLAEKMEVYPGLRSAIISITLEEQQKYNFKTGDSEGFVNYPMSIKGIICSVLVTEKKDHVKLSFRSKGSFPVNELAKNHFQGGGHVNAAGGTSYKSLKDTLNNVKSLLLSNKKTLKES